MAGETTELNRTMPSASERMDIYLRKFINTFYNPLEFDPNKYFSVSSLLSKEPLWGKHLNLARSRQGGEAVVESRVPKLTPQLKTLNMIGAVGAKSLGFASLAAVLHLAMRRAKNRKQKKNLRNYLNAAYPIMSLDPSLRDLREEEKQEDLGIEASTEADRQVEKTAEEAADEKLFQDLSMARAAVPQPGGSSPPNEFEDPAAINRSGWTPSGFLTSWVNELQDKAHLMRMPLHPVMQLAVPLAVAYSTYRGLDKVLDARERQKLEKLNARKRNLLQALMYKEYARTRQLDKQADVLENVASGAGKVREMLGKFFAGSEEIRKLPPEMQAALRGVRHPIHFAEFGVPAGFALWALASTALAYTAAKSHFDKNDPQRKRQKALTNFLRRRAISSAPPMFLSEEGLALGKEEKVRKRKKPAGAVALPKVEEAAVPPGAAAPVDARDPYAALLR